MPLSFEPLSDQLDAVVDGAFGEAVRFLPYKKGYMSQPIPDGSRAVQTGKATLVNKGTLLRAAGSTEFATRRAHADMFLSVRVQYLTGIQQGDRVELQDRNNQTFEIAYIEDGANTRRVIHLLKVKE